MTRRARRRTYSETLTPSLVARVRIRRASSSLTLKEIFAMGDNTVLPRHRPVNSGSIRMVTGDLPVQTRPLVACAPS